VREDARHGRLQLGGHAHTERCRGVAFLAHIVDGRHVLVGVAQRLEVRAQIPHRLAQVVLDAHHAPRVLEPRDLPHTHQMPRNVHRLVHDAVVVRVRKRLGPQHNLIQTLRVLHGDAQTC
jgi:hypothetical protein